MSDKFDPYDLLSVLVPGALLTAWIPICFPKLLSIPTVGFPEAFTTVVLTAVAVFLGQANQAFASVLQPLLFRLWKGKASERALGVGIPGYITASTAKRIRDKLEAVLGSGKDEATLFSYAMERARHAANPRVERFNSLYAYHRNLLALIIAASSLLIVSALGGVMRSWPGIWLALPGLALLLWLTMHRAWQRDVYYTREVLVTCESVLDGLPAKGPSKQVVT